MSKARAFMNKVLLGCGVLVALLAAFLALVLFVNRHDAPPSLEATASAGLLERRLPVPDSENGHDYFLGLGSAPDVDPRTRGTLMMASVGASAKAAGMQVPDVYNLDAQRQPAVRLLREACRKISDCVNALRGDPAGAAHWQASEQWLRMRYATLITHRQWRANAASLAVDAPTPGLTSAIDGQILYIIDIGQRAQGGDVAGARALLNEDLRFWRKVLSESDLLIVKMFARAMVQRHFELGTLVMRELSPARQAEFMPALWREPLTGPERSMRLAYAGEVEFTKSILRKQMVEPDHDIAGRAVWPFASSLMHVQATSNLHAKALLAMDKVLDVDYARLPAALAQARQLPPPAGEGSWLYNPIGKIVIASGSFDMTNYAVRVADLEGMRRIHVLAADLRSAGTSSADMYRALNGATTKDPYTGLPFAWSETRQAVIFRGLQEGARGEHVAPL